MSVVNPKVKRLHDAVADFAGKTGMNAATIASVTEKFVGLLATRFEHICDVALADENDGKVAIGVTIRLDMTTKAPVGAVTLGFSQRVKDEANFKVEDPSQMNIPFERAALSAPASSASSPGAAFILPLPPRPRRGRPPTSRGRAGGQNENRPQPVPQIIP